MDAPPPQARRIRRRTVSERGAGALRLVRDVHLHADELGNGAVRQLDGRCRWSCRQSKACQKGLTSTTLRFQR
jgi:hypothetical protein